MANYESAAIITDNEELMKKLSDKYIDESYHFGEVQGNKIGFRNRQGNTDVELTEFSSKYPDEVITAIMSFESDRYGTEHTVKYKNGEIIEADKKVK